MNTSNFSKLNEQQQSAVFGDLGNYLVIAGAGTGKTTVLVNRIAYLIDHFKVKAHRILALTFTNKAANQMKERIINLTSSAENVRASTFHSFCLNLIILDKKEYNLPDNFNILDTNGSKTLIKKIVEDKQLGYDAKDIKEVMSFISNSKERGIRAQNVLHANEEYISIYKEYQSRTEKLGLIDFSDLLLLVYEKLSGNEQYRQRIANRYSEILVDEFQDTNTIQYKILLYISGKSHVFAVGDDDQSIYAWRGANLKNMYDFLHDFKDVKQISLTQNYRSCENILEVANCIIKASNQRLSQKQLKGILGQGASVLIRAYSNSYDEGTSVAKMVKNFHETNKIAYRDMAILYRNNYQSAPVERALNSLSIPAIIIGGTSFFQREEIMNACAYMALCNNKHDDSALLRIINVPKRKIGKAPIGVIGSIANEQNCSLYQAIENVIELYQKDPKAYKSLGATYKKLLPFYQIIEQLHKLRLQSNINASDFVQELLEITMLNDYYRQKDLQERTPEGSGRVENLKSLIEYARKSDEDYEQSNATEIIEKIIDKVIFFLNSVALVSNVDTTDDNTYIDKVNLLTIHAAKGLEFKVVFVVGFENGILPSAYKFNDQDLDEERRIAYVAVTRAKHYLVLTYSLSHVHTHESTGSSPYLKELFDNFKYSKQLPFRHII